MNESSNQIKIALVGHCGPDAFALKAAIAGFVPGAQVDQLNSSVDFLGSASTYQLYCVNRVLDGTFESESGIELIRNHSAEFPPMMLISNFPESLQEAVEAGGCEGFGKRAMRSEEARAALLNALDSNTNEGHT